MSFFSYQPSQGLSAFRTKPLQHTGGKWQDFIDPTLDPNGGLDDLSLGDTGLDPRDVGQNESGGFFSTGTGTQFGVSDQLRGLLDEQEQNPQAAQQAAQGPQGADKTAAGIQNVVSGAKTAQTLAKAAEGPDLFGGKKQDTEGLDLNTPETDWTSPEAVGKFLNSGRQAGDVKFDFGEPGSGGGLTNFNLGVDTKLDSGFLDSFENPSTGTRVGGFADANLGGMSAGPNMNIGGGTAAITGVLSLVGGIQKGELGNILGGAGQLASGLAKIFPGQVDAIGEVLKAALTEAGLGGLLSGGGELLGSIGIESIGDLSPYIAAAKGLFDVAMIATNDEMDDGEKAIQATKAATKAAAAIAAPFTFGASLAVTQIWDMIDNLRSGMPIGESMVKAADPTAIVDFEGGGIAQRIYAPSANWQSFIPKLMQGQGTQGEAFDMIQKAMPYVRTKAELAQLVSMAEGWVSSATGIPRDTYAPFGTDPYMLETIPGVGPKTHGQKTQPVDWAEPTLQMRQLIQDYLKYLPGDPLTADATPDQLNVTGPDFNRLWNQFRGKDPTWGSSTHMRDYIPDTGQHSMQGSGEGNNNTYEWFVPDTGSFDVYSAPGETQKWYGSQSKLATGFDPVTGQQTWYDPEGTKIPGFEEQFQPSDSWYQFMTGIDPAALAEQQAAMAAQQGAQPQTARGQGLSSFDPNNPKQDPNRGIPDDGNPGHPYELDQSGRPVHPEVWGIPGMRMGGGGA